jgi:hypothetical protein
MGAVTDSMGSMDAMHGPMETIDGCGMTAGPWQVGPVALTFLIGR